MSPSNSLRSSATRNQTVVVTTKSPASFWNGDYVVSIQEIEDFLLEGDVPANPGVSDDEVDDSSRWVKINDRTAHQHLVFTNEDQGSTYAVVLGYVLDYVAPAEDDPDPVPFFPLPFPFPFPSGRP